MPEVYHQTNFSSLGTESLLWSIWSLKVLLVLSLKVVFQGLAPFDIIYKFYNSTTDMPYPEGVHPYNSTITPCNQGVYVSAIVY